MNCPNCNQPTETGAAFCGNCGHPLRTDSLAPVLPVTSAVEAAIPAPPTYALSTPAQYVGETKALLAVLFGIIGIAGALFVPLLGLVLGIAGLVLGTMSHGGTKRRRSTIGIILSSLAVLAGLASWAYAISQDTKLHDQAKQATSAVTASDLSTPCYSVGFVDNLNVSNNSGSCNMSAYDGTSLDTSTNAYKVFANRTTLASNAAFAGLAKQAIDKDVATSLPGFTVDTAQAALFAGSPAYIVHVSDKAHNIAVVEAAVLHKTTSGNNVFILVHAMNGKTASLNILETQWQWK